MYERIINRKSLDIKIKMTKNNDNMAKRHIMITAKKLYDTGIN